MNPPLDRSGHGRSRRELETSIASAIYAMTRAQFVRIHTLVELDGETLLIVSSHIDDRGVFWTTGAPGGEEWTVAAELLSEHPQMQRAVSQHAAVRKQESATGLHHCFYPVCLHGKVHAIVELKENHRPYPDEDTLISSFISLYINYVHWLDRTEQDPLTGALRPHLLEPAMRAVLADVSPRAGAQGCACCLVLVAVDHFHDLAQCYGQLFGDEILRRVAAALRQQLDASARIYCLDSDEFAVLQPALTSHQAELVFSGFLERIAEMELPNISQLQLSVGLSQMMPGDVPQAVLQRARRALCQAQSHAPMSIRRPGAR